MEVGGQHHAPAALPRGKTLYPLFLNKSLYAIPFSSTSEKYLAFLVRDLMALNRLCSAIQITKLLIMHLSQLLRYFLTPNTLFRNTLRLSF